MYIYKFGGASVKDAQSIQNLKRVVDFVGYENAFMIVSAMGKTTNTFEKVIWGHFKNENYLPYLQDVLIYHQNICVDLFPNKHPIFEVIETIIEDLKLFLKINKSTNQSYLYDQVVSRGEIISTKIISAYLNQENRTNTWIDVREYIKTDSNFTDANVDWKETEKNIKTLESNTFYITQGFIAADQNNVTTTLGREGSDYSASIFAYVLNADSLTIWKDVDGVLNADPRYFETQVLLEEIPYREAIELAYYGASVIHPKTLQPLQDKNIPLFVKSFINPELKGTCVKNVSELNPNIPCFILKKNLNLISISTKDFSFIVEKNMAEIFKTIDQNQIKVNFIDNSAISLTLCVDDKFNRFENLTKILTEKYMVKTRSSVDLFTIRNYDENSVQQILKERKVLRKRFSEETAQFIIENL